MKLQTRRAVSPIIATLLLIAIAVASGIIVYVFTGSLAGNLTKSGGSQISSSLQLEAYNFAVSPGTCACTGYVVDLYLTNSGGGSLTIGSVYFDGTPLTLASTDPTSSTTLASINNMAYTAPTTTTIGVGSGAQTILFSAATAKASYNVQDVGQLIITFSSAYTSGTSHTVRVATISGATFSFNVIAGQTG